MPRAVNSIILSIALVVIASCVFFNAIDHPFVHDDVVFIVQNPQIGRLDNFTSIFIPSVHPGPHGVVNSYYRPILEIFYRLEYRLFSFNAAGFHLINILIHIVNGLLLFALLCRLQFARWTGFGISLLFLVHPIQSEAVACVSGISNLLVVFFILTSVYCYIRKGYVLALIGFCLALLTKEQAIILVPLLMLVDWYRKEHQEKERWILWLILAAITIVFLCLRSYITGTHVLEDILQSPGELKLRLLSIPKTLVMYLRLLVCPYDVHYYRNTDILASHGPGFIILGVLSAATVWLIRKLQTKREIIFGLAWFIITLVPVLNIVPLIDEYSFILTADHFLYLPMVGILITLGAVVGSYMSSLPAGNTRKIFILGLFGLGMALSSMTIYQNTFWRGEISLFEKTIAFEPNFARAHMLLAKAYLNSSNTLLNQEKLKSKQLDQACFHYNQALSIMKRYEQKAVNDPSKKVYKGFIKEIDVELAQCLMLKGQFNLAEDCYINALALEPQDVGVLNNLAVCYIQQGDASKAEEILKIALGFDPANAAARENLNALIKNNNPE